MNIRFALLLILLLNIACSYAQRNLIFEEYFEDNYLKWMQGSSHEYSAEVKDGVYHIEYKHPDGIWHFWQSIPVHPDTSFYIESKILPQLQTQNSVYGITWGIKDVNNYNAFLVSNMGNASVITCRGGQFQRIVNWTLVGSSQNDQPHILGIRYKGGLLKYYLDNKLAFTSSPLPFYGDLLGFVISGQTAAQIDYLRVQQDRAINLVENAGLGFSKENLGANVNSPYAELHPLIAHDGKSLFVTRKDHPDNIGLDKRDDAWVSYKQEDGTWSPIQNLGAPINNNSHNHVISVSPDNNTLLIGNTYYPNGRSKGKGISITHRMEDGNWEIPQDVIIDNYYNQNPIHSMYLAASKQLLLLSIERNDSYGHLDLYVSFLQKNGRFSQPKNLGKTINTTYEDGTPFLAADGKTLYFSSSGHGGYGSTDIFVSKRLDDTWRNWTTPQNLGPEINSNRWEGYYSISASGETAFFVSTTGKDHIGAEDIYKVIPPSSSKPDPVLLVKGKVYNAKTKEPIRAKILYYDLNSNKEMGDALSNSQDGRYQVFLPADNEYNFLSFKGGYYPISESLEVGKIKAYTEVEVDLFLYPIEEGETIPLNNIFFQEKTEELAAPTEVELDRLIVFMEKYPDMTIELNSEQQPKSEKMKKYLVSKGVDEKRIIPTNNKENNSFTIVSISKYDEAVQRSGNFDPEMDAQQVKKGQIFRLNNTFFPADSSYITKQAAKELIRLRDFLIQNPSISIEISGHTNGLPEHDYCDRLSEDRAKNVAQYLESKGIAKKRLQAKGYGKRQPIATNENLRGRQRNQRVEIKILEVGAKSDE